MYIEYKEYQLWSGNKLVINADFNLSLETALSKMLLKKVDQI